MLVTFTLLGLSICAAWLPPIRVGKQIDISPWLLLLTGAGTAGLFAGYLTWQAIVELCVLGMTAYVAGRVQATRVQRIVFGIVTAGLALALALHRLPGFHNPVLIDHIKLSADAVPFTLVANFDKAAVGLILLVFLCSRSGDTSEWKEVLQRCAPVALITAAITISIAIALGTIRPDWKLSQWTPVFLVVNLLFTCVAEEAFFRGFLQERLAKAFAHVRFGELAAILCSGLLFGLAHAAGDYRYIMLATVSGIGCAIAYANTRRIEAPIITHFTLNAMHFIGFTYPQLL